MALGYNPPPGTYSIVVKSKSNPEWGGLDKPFTLVKRKVPKLKPGFSVVNMEYTVPIKRTFIKGPNGRIGNYTEIVNWMITRIRLSIPVPHIPLLSPLIPSMGLNRER